MEEGSGGSQPKKIGTIDLIMFFFCSDVLCPSRSEKKEKMGSPAAMSRNVFLSATPSWPKSEKKSGVKKSFDFSCQFV